VASKASAAAGKLGKPAGIIRTLPPLPTVNDFVARSRCSQGLGCLTLTAAELEAARWWINGPLRVLAERYGVSPVVNSFMRTVEISGPRRGQAETGPHGRQSSRPGNALDLSVPGVRSREVVLYLATVYGRDTLFAILDGHNHVHLTRGVHPNSTPGVGEEFTKPDGSTGVRPIPGAGQGGGAPAPRTETGSLSAKQAALILIVVAAAVWYFLLR
jgi:hypothetical protein